MLIGPFATAREEKWAMVRKIRDKWLEGYTQEVLAIGVYGSMARGTDGPFSDIEMWAVMRNGVAISGHEFVLGAFKVEIDVITRKAFFEMAETIDDGWAIKAGTFIDVVPLHDPDHIFAAVKRMAMELPNARVHDVMREFMIWEPYETMGKLRNSLRMGNEAYVALGAKDLTWQAAKLIGLANRQYYTTRARTLAESLKMPSRPDGYRELAEVIMSGRLEDTTTVLQRCEDLWCGLNDWFSQLGISYTVDVLPF